jgi:hypothetical protein
MVLDLGNSDRRCEAPQGGAIMVLDLGNSDRRCEAPQGGAIKRGRGRKLQQGPERTGRTHDAPARRVASGGRVVV